jgi:4-hydroxybenzoate polyprenyltransferase
VQTVFAYFSAESSVDHMVYSCFWTWLHLLQFCVSNQSQDPEEDALNKPWRPIPSGLVSAAGARALRWILVPLCPLLSACLGIHWHSISLALASLAYHELHFQSHGLMRNVCNAWGYASFNAGAAMIASGMLYNTFRSTLGYAFAQ